MNLNLNASINLLARSALVASETIAPAKEERQRTVVRALLLLQSAAVKLAIVGGVTSVDTLLDATRELWAGVTYTNINSSGGAT